MSRLDFDLCLLDRDRFRGMLIVPDVHGHEAALAEAIALAQRESFFVLQLGDLVDRGPASAAVVARMRDVMKDGAGTFLNGNHEHKLARFVAKGNHASAGRTQTLDQLRAWGDGLLDWYLTEIGRGRLFARAPTLRVAHAAFHPDMMAPEPRPSRSLTWRALFGMSRQVEGQPYPARSQEWVHEIPEGIEVVVGHDVVSELAPHVEHGSLGGRAIWLDTGGWKGGRWSTLSRTWSEVGIDVEGE